MLAPCLGPVLERLLLPEAAMVEVRCSCWSCWSFHAGANSEKQPRFHGSVSESPPSAARRRRRSPQAVLAVPAVPAVPGSTKQLSETEHPPGLDPFPESMR